MVGLEYERNGHDRGVSRLRHSNLHGPGIIRRRRGKGFSYAWTTGERVDDPEILDRIRALVIPPAWQEVWICPWPHGHIQAVGTDAAGRRQYRYHDEWRRRRDHEKYERAIELGRAMPTVRKIVAADLAEGGFGRRRVLAAAVRLLDLGCFRIGDEEYAEEHGTFGVATLQKEHVRIHGDELIFDYPAKGSIPRNVVVADAGLVEVIGALRRRRGGGTDLLAWKEARRWVDVRSADINAYIKEIAGGAVQRQGLPHLVSDRGRRGPAGGGDGRRGVPVAPQATGGPGHQRGSPATGQHAIGVPRVLRRSPGHRPLPQRRVHQGADQAPRAGWGHPGPGQGPSRGGGGRHRPAFRNGCGGVSLALRDASAMYARGKRTGGSDGRKSTA